MNNTADAVTQKEYYIMMKKTLSLLLALLLGLSLLTGCSTDSGDAGDGGEQTGEPVGETGEVGGEPSAEPVTIRLGGLKGPTSMGLVKLIDDASQGLTESKIDFRMAGTANELTPLMVQGELDVLAGPSNLAAILYQNTKGAVQFAAINTLGVIYLVEKGGNTVATMEDLRGKTIYATGKGQIPEYALTYLLEQHGMEVGKDVEIEWKSEATEVVATIAMEDSAVALLPQPYVTVAQTQVEGLAIALNLTEQWDALQNGSQLITAGLIVRREFAEQHPEALATLMEEYAASAAWINENVEAGAALCEKYDIVKAPVAQKAIPYCNITWIEGDEMKTALTGFLQVLFDRNAAAVGGAMPGDDFYLTTLPAAR